MKHLIAAVTKEINERYTVTAADFTAQPIPVEHGGGMEREARALRILGRGWNAKPYKGTPAQIEAKIRRALEKKRAARLAEKLAQIEAVLAPGVWESLPNPLIIRIHWVKNRTWGRTAHASDNYGHTGETASGCGYCKGSTALASVLNMNKPVLRRLYLAKDAALRAKGPAASNNSDISYGAGYGALPYFAGGVGVSSLVKLLEVIGYSVTWGDDVVVVSEKTPAAAPRSNSGN